MRVSRADLTATDQFCGAGGQTAGAKQVAGVQVAVALNHWRLAIETHNTNHPETVHECADISQVDPRRYPRTDILLTSPECGNHSGAKNHQQAANALTLWDPRLEAERSRATMWDVPRFAECHRYRLIIVENVVEVRSWAPFDAWIAALASLGYRHEFVYFNSRFAPPTPGNRDRLYTVLWSDGCPAPNLDFTPEAFCDACDGWVQTVQTWRSNFDTALAAATRRNGGRRPERIRWGVYGVHYDYRCPACAAPVVPVSYPAWTAVDWTLPGARIGVRHDAVAFSWPQTIGLLRASADAGFNALHRARAEGERDGAQRARLEHERRNSTGAVEAELAQLQAAVAAFAEQSGIDLAADRCGGVKDAAMLGRVVAAVTKGYTNPDRAARRLRRLAEDLERSIGEINGVADAYLAEMTGTAVAER